MLQTHRRVVCVEASHIYSRSPSDLHEEGEENILEYINFYVLFLYVCVVRKTRERILADTAMNVCHILRFFPKLQVWKKSSHRWKK